MHVDQQLETIISGGSRGGGGGGGGHRGHVHPPLLSPGFLASRVEPPAIALRLYRALPETERLGNETTI